MSKFRQIDLSNVETISIRRRKSKVRVTDFAKVVGSNPSFRMFVESLPRILVAEDLRNLVGDIRRSRRTKKPVIVLMGAHVIKVGLSPVLIDLVKRKVVTAIGMNSAGVIHDVETAMWGKTSEDVSENILNGTFGMSKETGDFINETLLKAYYEGNMGFGEAMGARMNAVRARYRKLSILATCHRLSVPVTVHVGIGADIVHQQPTMSGSATGELSFRDFKVLCNVVKDLRGGGVVMNFGSAVILPEVFLKALTVARNLGYPARGFTTANFDMLQHYRPRVNIVERPTQDGGTGYQITGHHEIMIPLLAAMIRSELR
ncbi:MAG: hypothetical protein ACE5H0_02600 [Bacteroidota bacterium]